MRRCHVVAFLFTVLAGCSGSSSNGPGTSPDAAPAGTGGAPATGGSGGTGEGTGGTPATGGSGEGTGGSTPDAGPADASVSTDATSPPGTDGGGATGVGPGPGMANPANVIWFADPAKGDAVFKNMNEDGGCSVTVLDDPDHGKVRKFNRPPGVNRCEAKGAAGFDTKEGDTVYVGMRYKIDAPMDLTVTSIFQWKTFDTPGHPNTLNFPMLIRPNAGRLDVEARNPLTAKGTGGLSGGTVLWSVPTPIGVWFTIVLGIHQSYDPKVGWVEVYYNGQQQMLVDGSMRVSAQTLDGGTIDPKWGMYGTTSSPKPQSSSTIGDIRIARDWASAAPENYSKTN